MLPRSGRALADGSNTNFGGTPRGECYQAQCYSLFVAVPNLVDGMKMSACFLSINSELNSHLRSNHWKTTKLFSHEILHATDAVKGIDAHVVHGYVVHDNDSNASVQLTYPRDGHQKVITGRSFHHGRFVMKLRGAASKAGYVL